MPFLNWDLTKKREGLRGKVNVKTSTKVSRKSV